MLIDTNNVIRAMIFGRVHQKQGNWHNGRTTSYHLLLYVIEGELEMMVEEKRIHGQVGDLLLIPTAFRRPVSGLAL